VASCAGAVSLVDPRIRAYRRIVARRIEDPKERPIALFSADQMNVLLRALDTLGQRNELLSAALAKAKQGGSLT
jgi:hypothetical protein